MPKFVVQLEDRVIVEKVIEAETIEDAVAVAKLNYSGDRTEKVHLRPTWAEPVPPEEGAEVYELTHEIQGECADCGLIFLSRHSPNPDWPWVSTSGDEGYYTEICYPCAQKRKENGNYCPDGEHYYKRDCCPHEEKP